MLEHWLELFPDTGLLAALETLPTEEIQHRIRQHPASWTRLVREVLAADDAVDDDLDAVLYSLSSALCDAMHSASEAAWCSAWDTGLLRCLEDLINDEFIGGICKERLVSAQDERIIERIGGMFNILIICAARVFEDARPQETTQMLDVLETTVVRLYSRLWTARDSIILEKTEAFNEYRDSAASDEHTAAAEYELDELYVVLNLLGRLTVDSLREHRTIKLLESRIPHVIFVTWIHSTNSRTRCDALANIGVLSLAGGTDRDPWTEFFGDLLGSGFSHERVTDAIVRDLVDGEFVDESLTSVLCFLSVWHRFNDNAGKSLLSNVLLAPSCLAAMRRQLCRGTDEDPEAPPSVASEVFMNMYFGLEA